MIIMANYLALIAFSKNDLMSFLFQQLIKTHSLRNSPLIFTHDIHDVIHDVIAVFTVCASSDS